MVHYAAFIFGGGKMHFSRFAAQLTKVVDDRRPRHRVHRSDPGRGGAGPEQGRSHFSFPAAEAGFDPVRISDLYSATVLEGIFERLLTYDYLARPAKVVPMLAESMPEVTDNGRTYTFKIRKGIYFAPDPIWKGAKRELVAQDVVYSFMRFLDPKNRAPYAFLLEGKIVGLDEHAAKAKKSGKLRLRREDSGARGRRPLHGALPPQGNGLQLSLHRRPHLARHRRPRGDRRLRRRHDGTSGRHRSRICSRAGRAARRSSSSRIRSIAASPGISLRPTPRRGTTSSSRTCAARRCRRWAASKSRSSRKRSRAGSRSSRSSSIIWHMPETFAPSTLDGDRLKPAFADQGILLFRTPDPDMTYTAFNVRDPVIGGFSKEKIALRRAMAMAYDVDAGNQGRAQGPGGRACRCRFLSASWATIPAIAA